MSPSELWLQLDDVIRQATAMRDAIDAGGLPMLADARILRAQAQCTEMLTERAQVALLRATPERTPAEDRAAQVVIARGVVATEGEDEVAKWSAA